MKTLCNGERSPNNHVTPSRGIITTHALMPSLQESIVRNARNDDNEEKPVTNYFLMNLEPMSNKVLGLIRRTFGPHNSEGVSTAYKTLVRPILQYGCQVWNPYLVKHIKSIESVQRRATRVICGSEKE